jgi:hypothetical protein
VRRWTATLVAACAACGGGGGSSATATLEAKLRRALADALDGAKVTRVRCPTPAACTAELDGASIPIVVEDAGAELAWRLDGLVVDAEPLAVAVFDRLAELELTAAVDCGPRLRVVEPGAVVACTIGSVRRGASVVYTEARALATVAVDGTADIELVLGADAIAARTAGVTAAEVDELDRRSRALDRGDPLAGAEDGTETAPTDVVTGAGGAGGAGPAEAPPVDAAR